MDYKVWADAHKDCPEYQKKLDVSNSDKGDLLAADRAQLDYMLAQRQMLSNYRATEAAMIGRVTMDSLFVQISRSEYEMLVNLAIEALRNRLSS